MNNGDEGELEAAPAEEPQVQQEEIESTSEQEPEQVDAEVSDEQSTPDEETVQRFKITFGDGDTRELTEEEIVKGWLRQEDYTRKTQTVAEQRRQWEAEVQAKNEDFNQAVTQLQGWLEFYAAHQPQEPDWLKIAEENPAGWVKQKAKWEQESAQRAEAMRVHSEIRKVQEAREMQQTQAKFVQSIAKDFPEWSDKSVMERDVQGLINAGQKLGFSAEDILSTTDTRALKVLKLAAKALALEEKKPSVEKLVAETVKRTPLKTASKANGDEGKRLFEKNPTIANAVRHLNF